MINNPVKNYFEEIVDTYASNFSNSKSGVNFNFNKRLEIACDLAKNYSGSLLECAVGTGEVTQAILKSSNFHHASIVDISPQMLNHAKDGILKENSVNNLEFINSDIFKFLKNNNENFNIVVCIGLIAHVGQLENLLGQLKSKLQIGGSILLQTTLNDHLGTKIVRLLSQNRYSAKYGYKIYYFSQKDIEQICQKVGLRIVEMKRYSVGFPFGDKISSLANYYLETKLQNWASKHGSEAIYLLSSESDNYLY